MVCSVVWFLLSCDLVSNYATAQTIKRPTRVAQRNEFYVAKPSTTPPTARSTARPSTPPQTQQPPQQPPAATSKILYSRISGFNIPFKVDSNDEAFVEVHLYSSANQGATWEFLDRQPTNATEFPFRANGEGEYWFAIKTLDRNRQLLPEGDPQPELRIIVDTTQPKLEMTAAADPAGRIVCRWNASDRYLKPQSLQLLYKPSFDGSNPDNADAAWQSVTVNTPTYAPGGIYVDQLAFWPETNVTGLDVRIAIADEAGNVVSADRRLKVETPSWRHSNRATARPTDRPAIDPSQVPYVSNTSNEIGVRNMKCEDGSCEVPPVTANDPQWKQAFYSKLRPKSPENYRVNQSASDRQTVPPAIFRENPYAKVPSTNNPNGSNAQANVQANTNQTNHVANQRTAMLIGSEPQYAAPPVPAGWTLNDADQSRPVQPQPLQQLPRQSFETYQSNPPGGSQFSAQAPPSPDRSSSQSSSSSQSASSGDVWQSEVQHDSRQSQTSTGSTMSPDHRMLPVASGGSTPRRTDAIPSNPNQINNAGDQWVSKSSTNFPRNQYQGPDRSTVNQTPNSQLAPRVPGIPTPNSFETIGNSRPIGQMLNTGYTPRTARPDFPSAAPPSNLPQGPVPGNIGRASTNGPTKTNTQIISTKRFRLNYDINAIDPSGVGKVDLYITQDKGRSWTLWGQDPDNRSPFPVEVRDQGMYGFRVVVHSKDGLVGVGPSSGDDADMWVRVDTQTPLVQITSVPYGRGNEAGRLVINYRASDDFLTLRPVRLSYSRAPQGPWTIIEDNLRNDGRYLWKVNRAVPDRIFLRIEAMDLAGNRGVHSLSQSVDVSGLVPRGTIHGVEPVGQ